MPESLYPLREEPHHLVDPGATWLERYKALGLSRLSPAASAVVEQDARMLASDCIVPYTSDNWPKTRVRRGLVVGAVQSGKTASMLAVCACLLDRGVDVLVILAGTRIALWKQTYERLLKELDGTSTTSFRQRRKQRLIIPHPAPLLDAEQRPGAPTYMAGEVSRFRQALAKRRPVILVIPKVDDHLIAVSRFLESHLKETADARPVEMVILDDEADDGSVLDANERKVIPRRIEMLWTGRHEGSAMGRQLHATYVAYTATPQANLLQADHNPLAPREFCAALRTPYKSGLVENRELTFHEPLGLGRYYCGGEYFYVELQSGAGYPVHTLTFPSSDGLTETEHHSRVQAANDALLLDGLRAYLVAASVRLKRGLAEGRVGYQEAAEDLGSEERQFQRPHTMLVHPSARMDLHRQTAWRLVVLARGLDPDAPTTPDFDPAQVYLDAEGIERLLAREEPLWARWLERFRRTKTALDLIPGASELPVSPDEDWPAIRDLMLREVVPFVRIRIINSDPDTDDRPRFDEVDGADGRRHPPPDLLTIFISGNVMSRGLTLEGLCSSVFTRSSNEPAADTQMQMQRWFGYRGAAANLCRLFCFDDQLDLFRTYHEHDTALRSEILAAMQEAGGGAPVTVLTGARSLATAKVRTSRLPLHPGPSPFVRLIEVGTHAETNAQLLHGLRGEGDWLPLRSSRTELGEIRVRPASLSEVASILEGLRYSSHDPDPAHGVQFTRWTSLERQLVIESSLFRSPGTSPGEPVVDVRQCPYSIAAYLRLWAAALDRPRCDGLFATHTPGRPWSLVQPTLQRPHFHIGIKFGSLSGNSWEELGLLEGVRAMKRGATRSADGVWTLNASWGSRGTSGGYLGDQLFDYHHHRLASPDLHQDGPLWRPAGHPGLVLFQLVRAPGAPRDAVAVGLALPHGGPEQFAAVSTA